MGSTRREKKGAVPRRMEDGEAILRRRRFLIESALAGVGLGLAASGRASVADAPQPCLEVAAPRPCLSPPPPPPPPPQPCLVPPLPQPCLVPMPSSMQLRTLLDPGGAFAVSVPGDWQVTPSATGTSAAAPGQQAGFQITTIPKTAGDFSQCVSTLLETWQKQIPGWTVIGRWPTTISGRPAVLVRAEGQPGGTAMVGDYLIAEGVQSNVVACAYCGREAQARWQPVLLAVWLSLQVGPAAPGPVVCLSVPPRP